MLTIANKVLIRLRLSMSKSDTGFIFLHGFLGRAETQIAGRTFEYFRGLRAVAEKFDIAFAVPQMPGRTGVTDRAEVASQAIKQMQAPNIVLVGNSMGGLVARTLAHEFDPDHRVRSVLTIATPHRGSPLADQALEGESALPTFVVDLFKAAVHDLSVFNADVFNAATPDRTGVDYRSWAFTRDIDEMPMLLKSRAQKIFEIEGPNDGLVSVKSATWGTCAPVQRGDHLESIGWSPALSNPKVARPYDQTELWRQVISTGLKPDK